MMGHQIQISDYTCLDLDIRGQPALRARDFTFDTFGYVRFYSYVIYSFDVMLFYF